MPAFSPPLGLRQPHCERDVVIADLPLIQHPCSSFSFF
jgi:hypothetical protein